MADPRGEKPEEVTLKVPSEADHGSSVLEGRRPNSGTAVAAVGPYHRKMQGLTPYLRLRGLSPRPERDVACRRLALGRCEGDLARCFNRSVASLARSVGGQARWHCNRSLKRAESAASSWTKIVWMVQMMARAW